MNTVEALESRLSAPGEALIEDFRAIDGDLLVIGAGGKLGPGIVRKALRAIRENGKKAKLFAASRFSDGALAEALKRDGAELVCCDIGSKEQIARLPNAPNVVFLIGYRFGATGNEANTWFFNTYLPGDVMQRFAGSRVVSLSSGNVYPYRSAADGPPTEDTPPGPIGEYAMTCLGRERVMSYFSAQNNTPLALLRLNYATEMRYGVLVDIARAIQAGEPVDISMGLVNLVWQGYATEVVLRSLLHAACPPFLLNVAGPEILSVRQLADKLGVKLGRSPIFQGTESPNALLSNAGRCHRIFGYPKISIDELIDCTAAWLKNGLPLRSGSTGFNKRSGRF